MRVYLQFRSRAGTKPVLVTFHTAGSRIDAEFPRHLHLILFLDWLEQELDQNIDTWF